MKPVVSIIMGSTSDLPVMEKAAKFFDEMEIPFEMNALSAHRTPAEVEAFAKEAAGRGLKVIIAGAGMAAALPGVIAASQYDVARHRGSYQGDAGRFGCHAFHYPDASRHTGGYGGCKRSAECRHSGRTDAVAG